MPVVICRHQVIFVTCTCDAHTGICMLVTGTPGEGAICSGVPDRAKVQECEPLIPIWTIRMRVALVAVCTRSHSRRVWEAAHELWTGTKGCVHVQAWENSTRRGAHALRDIDEWFWGTADPHRPCRHPLSLSLSPFVVPASRTPAVTGSMKIKPKRAPPHSPNVSGRLSPPPKVSVT